MKKFLTLTLLVLLLAATVSTAFASGENQLERRRGRNPFALTGTITAIDGTAVTVNVIAGNRLVKTYIGKALTVQTTDLTRFLLKNADGTVSLVTLADLQVGQNVSVNGRVTLNEKFVAKRITVGARLLHLP